jgi:hypothetical protein
MAGSFICRRRIADGCARITRYRYLLLVLKFFSLSDTIL